VQINKERVLLAVSRESEQPHKVYYSTVGRLANVFARGCKPYGGRALLLLLLSISRSSDRFLKKTVPEEIFVAGPPSLLNLCQLSN
jgi:hypothetical protein